MSGARSTAPTHGTPAGTGTPLSPLPPSARHPLLGVAMFVSAAFLLAGMDASTKYLATHHPVPVVVAMRYLVHLALMLVLLAPTARMTLIRTRRTGLVLVRAGCLAAASILMALALQRMPVAESTAIVFLAPLLVVLVSGPLLGETVGAIGWISSIAGFAGILLIARPGSGLDPTGLVCAMGAACVIVAYQLLSRVLASTERTVTLLFYTALVGALVYGIALPWFWDGLAPTPLDMALFAGTGILGGLGHFLFTAAHRHAPASLLAPLMYVQLIWAGLLGWSVFGHVPDGVSTLGMCIVAASGVLVAWHSHQSSRDPATAAAKVDDVSAADIRH